MSITTPFHAIKVALTANEIQTLLAFANAKDLQSLATRLRSALDTLGQYDMQATIKSVKANEEASVASAASAQ